MSDATFDSDARNSAAGAGGFTTEIGREAALLKAPRARRDASA
jgi:hypothetical protein